MIIIQFVFLRVHFYDRDPNNVPDHTSCEHTRQVNKYIRSGTGTGECPYTTLRLKSGGRPSACKVSIYPF